MGNEYDELIAAPDQKANEYDAALQIQGDEKRQALRSSIISTKDSTPDNAAKALQLSKESGVPAPVVERNMPEVAHQVQLNAYDELLQSAPVTAQHLSDPNFARIAKDDAGNMQAYENTANPPPPKPIVNSSEFSKMVTDYQKANPSLTFDDSRRLLIQRVQVNDTDQLLGPSRPGGPKADLGTTVNGLWQSVIQGGEVARQGIRAQFADALGLTDMKDDAINKYRESQLTTAVNTPKFEGKTGELLYGGASNVVQNAPVLAAAIATRNPNIAAALAAIQTEASAYPKYRERGATGGQAALGAGIEGVIEFATEKLPLDFLAEKFGKIPTWQLFVGEQAREQITEQIATHSQDLTDALIANPNMTIKQYLAERPDAALQTAVAVIMQGVAISTAHKAAIAMAGHSEASIAAEQHAQTIQQLAQLGAASKVAQRDPQSFEQFANASTEAGNIGDVYVDARTFAQSAGPALAEIVKASPAVAAQLDEAMTSGGDLVIPTGEYTTRIAPIDSGNSLLPHLRMGPEAFSQEEAKTFMQGQAEQFNTEAQKVLEENHFDAAFRDSAQNVEKELLTQLNNANRFTPEVNNAYSKLMGAFYTVQAARLGVTPEQMYVKYPLQIRAEALGGKGHKTLNQSPAADAAQAVLQEHLKLFPAAQESPLTPEEFAPVAAALTPLLAQAEKNKPAFDKAVTGIAGIVGGEAILPKLKGIDRAARKVVKDYGGKASMVRDLVRATIAVRTPADAAKAVDAIAQHFEIDRVKDRFAAPTEAGYSDILVNVKLADGSIAEIQISTPEMLAAKEIGHLLYVAADKLSEDHPQFAKLNAAQAALYSAAKEANSSAEIGVPSRNTLAGRGNDSPDSRTYAPDGSLATGTPSTSKNLDPLGNSISDTSDESIPKNRVLEQDARGQIAFGKDLSKGSVISLLQHADLSTFLHETGHFYLEVLSDMASQPEAPAEIVADMNKLLQWFGVADLATWRGMSVDQQREHHEQLARGFETYLFEGHAPSIELNGLFSRFRAWLINVYKEISKLGVQLNDEVRGVFDRMIATNDQITAAESARNYSPLFQSAEQAGYTPAEWAAYQEQALTATQDAVDLLEKRGLRDMQWLGNARSRALKKLQKDVKAKRDAIEQEVTAEVRAQPEYAAQRFMKYGELPEASRNKAQREIIEDASLHGTKMNLADLKEMYGEGPAAPWRYLPTGKTGMATAKDGLHPDVIAELFGYKSGDEMVRKVLEAQPESTVIEGMTDQRTLERYGDLSHPDSMARAANEAIHNEARARFIATELRALEKAMNPREDTGKVDKKGRKLSAPILPKAAKEFADQMIARKKIREVRPAQYEAAEARAARAAEKAMQPIGKSETNPGRKTGDFALAVSEKRNQLINHYATRAAYEAQDDFEGGLRYLRKFNSDGTRKNLDHDYLDQIDALLDRFDIRRMSDKEAARRKSLVQWVESQEELGFSPTIDPGLLNEARRQPVREMTVEEFRGLLDAIRNIEHLGRLKKKLLTLKDQREFEDVVDTFVGSIEANAKKTVAEQRMSDRGVLVSARRLFSSFLASHRKFASHARELDGWADDGAAWNYLVRNMNDAGNFEAVEREKATMALHELLNPVIKAGKLSQKQYFPGSGKSFTREERIGMALNMGNEVNRERVMAGEKLNDAQLDEVLESLTAEDWQFVQKVWNLLESYRPMIAEKERRLTGAEPEWVAPVPVNTKYGQLTGGYYPIKYDSLRSDRSFADVQAEVGKQMQQGFYTRSQTRRGHLKARAESTGRPLRYDLDVIAEHLSQVVHDLAWHEYLIDANRLLRSGKVETAVRDHYGPIMLQSMKKMLTDIAVGEVGSQEAGDHIMNHLRYGATIAGLGLNVANAIVNTIGITQSMSRVGTKWIAKGMVHWMGSAVKLESAVGEMHEKSEFMRLRGKTLNRELSEIRNKVNGEGDSKLTAAYFWLQNRTQLVVDTPTWWGAYEKAMAAPDMTEDKAIALADQAVLDAQGGGQIKDLSGIQRGGAGLKLFTTFYSFFNTTYNATAEAFGRTDFKKPGDIAMLAADMALLYTIPALLGTLVKHALRGDLDDEKKMMQDLIADQLAYVMGTMVLMREASVAAQMATGLGSGAGYTGPAATRFFSDLSKLGQQANQGEIDAAFLKALNNVGGVVFHYPSGQINRTAEGMYEFSQGRTNNPGVLLSGPPPKGH